MQREKVQLRGANGIVLLHTLMHKVPLETQQVAFDLLWDLAPECGFR